MSAQKMKTRRTKRKQKSSVPFIDGIASPRPAFTGRGVFLDALLSCIGSGANFFGFPAILAVYMSRIKTIHAREILDSRGNPTVEVDVMLSDGALGRAAVPSGASTGKKEALELRDGDAKRFGGKGVLKAVGHVNTLIAKALKGKDPRDQEAVDHIMLRLDGTPNKANLGANAILGVSMAVMKAAAVSARLPLWQYIQKKYRPKQKRVIMPTPMMNILNGGAHASDSSDFQEFMILPVGAKNFSHAIQMGSEVFHALKGVLKKRGENTNVGDEGGFAPTLPSNHAALDVIMEAIEHAGYKPGKDIVLGMDAAADQFYKNGTYHLKRDRKTLSAKALIDLYEQWVSKYPLATLEDGLAEDDWDNWKLLNAKLGKKIQLVGDDLFVTNTEILRKGIGLVLTPKDDIANAILIKLNQIGTVTETVEAVNVASEAGWKSIVSHRSGETEDTTIAHLVVGLGTGQIKTGSLSRSDRVGKYNELMRIEEAVGKKAVYSGGAVLAVGNE